MPEQEYQQREPSDVEQLEVIMQTLDNSTELHHGGERREYSLTKGDVMMIYRIAKIAGTEHICPFQGEERTTLQGVAKNINRTQKIAAGIIIVGTTTAILSGIWFALKHVFSEWVKAVAR